MNLLNPMIIYVRVLVLDTLLECDILDLTMFLEN